MRRLTLNNKKSRACVWRCDETSPLGSFGPFTREDAWASPAYGAMGAAVATVVAEGAALLFQAVAACGHLPLFVFVHGTLPQAAIGAAICSAVRVLVGSWGCIRPRWVGFLARWRLSENYLRFRTPGDGVSGRDIQARMAEPGQVVRPHGSEAVLSSRCVPLNREVPNIRCFRTAATFGQVARPGLPSRESGLAEWLGDGPQKPSLI